MSALAITGVGLHIDTTDILKGITLSVPAGAIAALLGPTASGKTALLRTIAGLDHPHAGTVRIGDETVFDATAGIALPPERRRVGLMFQSDALSPRWSALDNLVFTARQRGRDAAEAKAHANRLLDRLGMIEIARQPVEQLSAVQRRRTALGRALICEPKLLLLDDPLGGRADDAGERMWLKQLLVESGITTLIATRDRTEAFALAGHIALINAGIIEQEGAASDIFARPATPFVASFLAPCNRIAGTLVEKAGLRAFIDVASTRLGGVNCTKAALGETCTGMIRIDRVLVGGGPGANRIRMKLAEQTYLGERWELAFVNDALTIRAYASAPLRHEFYHIEFPPDALWVY